MARRYKIPNKQPSNGSWRQYVRSLIGVSKTVWQVAPTIALFQIGNALIGSVLPLITTYLAALTTTALAEAYAGDAEAGQRALYLLVFTAALSIVTMVWRSVDQYINQINRYKLDAIITDQMHDRFLSLEFWRYDDKENIDMFDKAIQFSRFFPYVFDRFAQVISVVIGIITSFAALVLVNVWLGLILLLAILPSIFLQLHISRLQANFWQKHVGTRRKASIIGNTILMDAADIAELRIYGVVQHLVKLYRGFRDQSEKAEIELERRYIAYRLLADGLEAIVELGGLVWIVLQITRHLQPVGQFLFVQQTIRRFLSSSSQLVSLIDTIDRDVVNLNDYQQFMELPTISSEGIPVKTPIHLELQHVTFGYPNQERMVLEDVSMTFEPGSHVAIVGENGAGKSTLVKIISGLYQPAIGQVLVNGTTLTAYDIQSWHRHLSVLHQNYITYYFANARDNIAMGDVSKPFSEARLNMAMDKAQASEFIHKLPKGPDNYISNWMDDEEGAQGVSLSGGQHQRVALARNFYRDSPVIILDEPTSAIDALAESRIYDQLFADTDKTIITISHRLSTIKKADLIYVMKDGRLVEQGTHFELVARKGHYYTIFRSQLEDA